MVSRLKAGALAVMAVLLGSACGQPNDPTATASTGPADTGAPAVSPAFTDAPVAQGVAAPASLPDRLDCLRKTGGVLIIGHRGGPTRDFPENAIETLQRTFKAGTRGFEIDIAQTKDGVLTLMHDDELDRTSSGTGLVSDHTWAEISRLKLETYTKTTEFHPPLLKDALEWAVKNDVILELDKKKSAPWSPIIDQVRAAKAENNVFLITYTDDQAAEVHKLAPDLVITATVDSTGQLDHLLSLGVNAEHLIAWTGTSNPDAKLWKAMADRKIESSFGTQGSRNTSLEDKYFEDGDGSEFDKLIADGLPMLVTDLTDKVSRQLSIPLAKSKACGL